ncbi:hypothetical protein [Eggerthella sp. YY7918]|uniref:hypothetical protein n=1 Tax=Eggerthella sp. (strain YY7918) TaxID=502558 RepID=UPI0005A1342F|nr:hypothetical protein [Eggerthella sp. YY7918]
MTLPVVETTRIARKHHGQTHVLQVSIGIIGNGHRIGGKDKDVLFLKIFHADHFTTVEQFFCEKNVSSNQNALAWPQNKGCGNFHTPCEQTLLGFSAKPQIANLTSAFIKTEGKRTLPQPPIRGQATLKRFRQL